MAKFNVTALLQNVDEHVTTLEALGIKCSKRNGKAEDPKQKIAIDLATKIGLTLVKERHYVSAYNVAYPLCNMTMGPRKSIAAHAIAKALIRRKQGRLAKQMACLIAPLKGKLKIKTAKAIASELINDDDIDSAKYILEALKNNPVEYAQKAVEDLNGELQKWVPKESPFLDAFSLKFSNAMKEGSKSIPKESSSNKDLQLFQFIQKLFNSQFPTYKEIRFESKKNTQSPIMMQLSKSRCSLKIQLNGHVTHYDWNFNRNVMLKNNHPLPTHLIREFNDTIKLVIKRIENKEVDVHAC